MNISQFFLFVVERNMLSNANGLDIFYTAFKEASGGADVVFLDHTKFHYGIYLLAKTLFHKEDSPIEAMFSQLLTDKIMTSDSRRKITNRNG